MNLFSGLLKGIMKSKLLTAADACEGRSMVLGKRKPEVGIKRMLLELMCKMELAGSCRSDSTVSEKSESHASRYQKAFTLTEILICLGIVVVLAAILFPALGKIRDSAASTKCISNLQAIGGLLSIYGADHQGMVLPRSMGYDRPSGQIPPPELRSWPSILVNEGYTQNVDIFYCPSFSPQNSAVAKYDIRKGGGLDTYGIRTWAPPNCRGADYVKWREEPKPIATIARPSEFFLVADSFWKDWGRQGYGITPGAASQAVHLRHAGKANALFADGHVAAMPAEYFASLMRKEIQGAYSNGDETHDGGEIFTTSETR